MTNATDGVLSQAKQALYNQAARLRDSRAAGSGADGREEATASGKDGGVRRLEGATLVTLSQEAKEYLAAKFESVGFWDTGKGEKDWSKYQNLMAEEKANTLKRLHELNREIDSRRQAQDNLEKNQEEYEKLLNTEATPAVELTGAAKEEALKIARAHGKSKMSGYNVIFADEATNKTYILKDDGSVWANETGVPRTEEQRRSMLSRLKDAIEMGKAPLDGLIAERDALQAEWDAMEATTEAQNSGDREARKADALKRMAALEARYGSFGDMMSKSGQTSVADQPASGAAEDESTGGGSNSTEDNEASAS